MHTLHVAQKQASKEKEKEKGKEGGKGKWGNAGALTDSEALLQVFTEAPALVSTQAVGRKAAGGGKNETGSGVLLVSQGKFHAGHHP